MAKSFYRLEISGQIREEKQKGLAKEKIGLEGKKVSLTAEREPCQKGGHVPDVLHTARTRARNTQS